MFNPYYVIFNVLARSCFACTWLCFGFSLYFLLVSRSVFASPKGTVFLAIGSFFLLCYELIGYSGMTTEFMVNAMMTLFLICISSYLYKMGMRTAKKKIG